MSIDLADYDKLAKKVTRSFWESRLQAKQAQQSSGKSDRGERSSVTSGKNMDGFLNLIKAVVKQNGLKNADICLGRQALTLPGYFRPTKLWDMLIMHQERLVAVIELKSHVGPSFGNNCNNRAEEAIGSAHDLWTAYREAPLEKNPNPSSAGSCLSKIAKSHVAPSPVRSPTSLYSRNSKRPPMPNVMTCSCQKLVQENLYTAAATILSPRKAKTSGAYSELSELTGLKNFIITLAGHIAAEAARQGG